MDLTSVLGIYFGDPISVLGKGVYSTGVFANGIK